MSSVSPLGDERLAEIAVRFGMCQEDIIERPFSHPVVTGWYVEDVDVLIAERDRLRDALEEIGRIQMDDPANLVAELRNIAGAALESQP